MADSYLQGKGTEENVREAMILFKKCAGRGNVYAMLQVARLYEEGNYIPQDIEKALKYYKMVPAEEVSDIQEKIKELESLLTTTV